MSQKTTQLVIGWLLTDEDLRLRFTERPLETLQELQLKGYELTDDEIDALVRSDPEVWPALARRIHPRLQRCNLRARGESGNQVLTIAHQSSDYPTTRLPDYPITRFPDYSIVCRLTRLVPGRRRTRRMSEQ